MGNAGLKDIETIWDFYFGNNSSNPGSKVKSMQKFIFNKYLILETLYINIFFLTFKLLPVILMISKKNLGQAAKLVVVFREV
jgi:hypothetical protein